MLQLANIFRGLKESAYNIKPRAPLYKVNYIQSHVALFNFRPRKSFLPIQPRCPRIDLWGMRINERTISFELAFY